MTRSKIQKMKFFIFLLIFLLGQTAVCDGHFREKKDTPESTLANKTATVNAAVAQVLTTQQKNVQQNTVLPGGVTRIQNDNKTQDNTTSKPIDNTNKTMHTSKYPGEGHMPSFNPGAIRRGFYVFVGLTIVVMAYIVFRSFRLNKTRAQMVRKYGVLTHRQDVEMRPLPLEEEDDEDTTIFDASNVLTNNVQHQNL